MKTDLKALAQNIDNELLEYMGLYVKAHFELDAAYRGRQPGEPPQVAHLTQKVADLRGAIDKLEAVYSLYLWNRAWIVPGGHVHRSQGCHTLFANTRIFPVPECSALTEDQIVALAGDRACTHCYPSAPVEVLRLPSELHAPGEKEEAEAKAAKQAEQMDKAAEKTAKQVRVQTGSSGEKVYGTVRSARTEAMDRLWWAVYNVDQAPINDAQARKNLAEFDALASAIVAHRDGGFSQVDALEQDLTERVAKKYIKGLCTDGPGFKALSKQDAEKRYAEAKARLDALR